MNDGVINIFSSNNVEDIKLEEERNKSKRTNKYRVVEKTNMRKLAVKIKVTESWVEKP